MYERGTQENSKLGTVQKKTVNVFLIVHVRPHPNKQFCSCLKDFREKSTYIENIPR